MMFLLQFCFRAMPCSTHGPLALRSGSFLVLLREPCSGSDGNPGLLLAKHVLSLLCCLCRPATVNLSRTALVAVPCDHFLIGPELPLDLLLWTQGPDPDWDELVSFVLSINLLINNCNLDHTLGGHMPSTIETAFPSWEWMAQLPHHNPKPHPIARSDT